MSLAESIEEVKLAKAHALYWDNVKRVGTEGQALRSLDCLSREEAIKMLSAVQRVSIFKRDGKVIIQ